MVTGSGVRAAADRIRGREAPAGGVRERVSVRTVRKELGGGSFTDIGRELARWRELSRYDAVTERADLPEAFARRLTTLGRDLLELARVEASREGLSGFSAAEGERRGERDLLDEALDRVEMLEERLATLQAELDLLRDAGIASAGRDPVGRGMRGFVDEPRGRSLARDADAYWAAVRDALAVAMRGGGPIGVHGIYRALPDALKERGLRVGLPLTVGWLRHHLLREAEAGRAVVGGDGRFALPADATTAAGPDPMPSPKAVPGAGEAVPPALSPRRFWVLFVKRVHALLVDGGPLAVEDILVSLPPAWVRGTARYGAKGAGREILACELRQKLRVRIDRGRPFAELPDGRFEAMAGRPYGR